MKEPADYLNELSEPHLTMVEWFLRFAGYFIAGVLVALVVALLSACGQDYKSTKPEAVVAHCDQICYMPCTDERGDTGLRWEGDPDDARTLDKLDDEVIPLLKEKLDVCETRRQACTKCLDNLESQKVIIQ